MTDAISEQSSPDEGIVEVEATPASQLEEESPFQATKSIEETREQTRTILSQGLLLIFAGSALATFIWAFSFEPKITCYTSESNVSRTVESIYQPVQLRNIQDTQSQSIGSIFRGRPLFGLII